MWKEIFFPLTSVTVAVTVIVCPGRVGALWMREMEPPTVVSWPERKGARAFTAASSMAADSTGVASTGRDPLFTFSAVSSSVMVLVICAVIPLIIMIMLLCINACYQPSGIGAEGSLYNMI